MAKFSITRGSTWNITHLGATYSSKKYSSPSGIFLKPKFNWFITISRLIYFDFQLLQDLIILGATYFQIFYSFELCTILTKKSRWYHELLICYYYNISFQFSVKQQFLFKRTTYNQHEIRIIDYTCARAHILYTINMGLWWNFLLQKKKITFNL